MRRARRRLGADRRGDEGRSDVGESPEPRTVDRDQPVVADLLACQQSTDDADALQQTLVAYLFTRPALAGHVFVGGLARTERHPKPRWIHRTEGGDRLSDDRGVVALAWRVHDAKRQLRRL